MPETVVSSSVEVAATGAGDRGVHEGEEVDGGVVSRRFCGGPAVDTEVLGAEYRGWGRGSGAVVTGGALAAGYSVSSLSGHGDVGELWSLWGSGCFRPLLPPLYGVFV